MRLLVVENDMSFQRFLKTRLEEKCFAVDTAADYPRAVSLAEKNTYDLIVLEDSLPEITGQDLCREIRERGRHAPIILISNTSTLEHKLESYMAGVDDFVPKPFYFEELLARIVAILRRPRDLSATILSFGDLSLNMGGQTVRRGQRSVYLTRKEFALLELLMRNAGNVISRGELLEHVWDSGVDIFSRTIETHMLNLRRKINHPGTPQLIHSVSGRGYKIDSEK